MLRVMAVLGVALLAGCGGGPADMTDPQGVTSGGPVAPEVCHADQFQNLIGHNESITQVVSLPSPARIYQVGAPITQDYNPQRINIQFDKARIITRVYCG